MGHRFVDGSVIRARMDAKDERVGKGITARLRASKRRRQQTEDKPVYQAVHARDGGICQVCGIYCGQSIHLHHIIYRSLGGPTTLENLLSVCQKCHAGIHAREIEVDGGSRRDGDVRVAKRFVSR